MLQKYIRSTAEVGFTLLVSRRLEEELQNLTAAQSKVCNLVV